MDAQIEAYEEGLNPLDVVEELLAAHNWAFNRMNNDELMVQVAGKSCDYRLFFLWQEDMSALQFCCQYDLKVEKPSYAAASKAIMAINEELWMGHFDLPKDTGTPSFRHTCLMRGLQAGTASPDHIEDLVDISLVQCERYFHVFQLLSNAQSPDEQNMNLALMETKGHS